MIEIQISGISLKIDVYYLNGPRNQFIQMDMTFNFIFRQAHPGTCLCKVINNNEMVLHTMSLCFDTFMKVFSWKSLTKHKVKGHIYLDKLVTGSIYVRKYRIYRESPKISIFCQIAVRHPVSGLGSCRRRFFIICFPSAQLALPDFLV